MGKPMIEYLIDMRTIHAIRHQLDKFYTLKDKSMFIIMDEKLKHDYKKNIIDEESEV